jgi:hypothetical protein
LFAEVTELETTRGGLGGLVRSATRAGGLVRPEDVPTEASIALRLVAADGKQRGSRTVKGNDGGGLGLSGALGLAQYGGAIAADMTLSPRALYALNRASLQVGYNLQAMGLVGTSQYFRAQSIGLSLGGLSRRGMDRTAATAVFLAQQSAAMNTASRVAGTPSYEASLVEALDQLRPK